MSVLFSMRLCDERGLSGYLIAIVKHICFNKIYRLTAEYQLKGTKYKWCWIGVCFITQSSGTPEHYCRAYFLWQLSSKPPTSKE